MAEALARSLIKLIVTVGILAALYVFAIKPILDTTNNAFDQFGDLGGVAEEIQSSFDGAGLDSFEIDSFGDSVSDRDLKRLQRCVQRAGQNVNQLQRCTKRFQRK